VQLRLAADVAAALRRRPTAEAKLAGALRALAPHCLEVRRTLAQALEVLVRRSSFDRTLYWAAVRALSESTDRRVVTPLRDAIGSEDAGGFAALSAACFCKDATLTTPLSRAAASRHAHVAFAAEVARLARSETTGAHLASLAPKIKESHRIALCVELFVPLVRAPPLALAVAPALAVLRDAERHLGRWLVLAEVATRAGDTQPIAEASARSDTGPSSSRAAWSLVHWALSPGTAPPPLRPTAELVARLSDRPSSDRDTSFLFRLAAAAAPAAKAMLESIAKPPLSDEVSVRAAICLAKSYGRDDMRRALVELAGDIRREEIRGLAAAGLWDCGEHAVAQQAADEVLESKALGSQVWASLVRSAPNANGDIVSEQRFRRVQWGWVE
jgi:hypothetical protein